MGPLGWRGGREQTAAHREIRQGASQPLAAAGARAKGRQFQRTRHGWQIILTTAQFAPLSILDTNHVRWSSHPAAGVLRQEPCAPHGMVAPLIECTPLHRPAPHVRSVRAGS